MEVFRLLRALTLTEEQRADALRALSAIKEKNLVMAFSKDKQSQTGARIAEDTRKPRPDPPIISF